jgi:S-adenosylmethionine:tRNA ribosyltransferase-isomerase
VTALLAGPAPLHLSGPVPVATRPPEARGVARDGVRLMVSDGDAPPTHHRFHDLADVLVPGDALVVNVSATLAAALDAVRPDGALIVLHLSTRQPDGTWVVEGRRPAGFGTVPFGEPLTGERLRLRGGGTANVLEPFGASHRLFVAELDTPHPLLDHLSRYGSPIRYAYLDGAYPIEQYQTVFARIPGSAEMPSAARPFTEALVTRLVSAGVEVVPFVLHTGVSSLEGHEDPYPEWYSVPELSAARLRAAHARGGRVIAVGTTAVRALTTTADERGAIQAGEGWTNLVVHPGARVPVDGLITGLHEPEASHVELLRALAPEDVLAEAYEAALTEGYLWHEFGDSHLILR